MDGKINRTALIAGLLLIASGCGSSVSGDDTVSLSESQITSTDAQNTVAQDLVGELPAGNISSYGAITVGDDDGMASDLVAAFFKLDSSVSLASLSSAFNGDQTLCSVDDDIVDFEEISVGFIPSFNGLSKQAISAGENIVLGSEAGTFATIQSETAGAFRFYTLPESQVLPKQPVPINLQVDITDNELPDYRSAQLPNVATLENVDFGTDEMILSTSTVTWTPSSEPGTLVRIFASTAGGFFVENGMTVTCLAPDTGSFEFPIAIQSKLGADFVGGAPIVSRLAINTETNGNSVLFLIRESFSR